MKKNNLQVVNMENMLNQLTEVNMQTAQNIQSVSQMMNQVCGKVAELETNMDRMNDRVEHLENGVHITPYQTEAICDATHKRVRDLIGDDEDEYTKYHKAVYGDIWGQLRRNHGLCRKIGMTPKRNYDDIMDAIPSLYPRGGMTKLRADADARAEARRKARAKGYDA